MKHLLPALAGLFVLASLPAIAAPTVVELFQSQGCSSCPPAIANVNALADRPDILALSFSVTYWDRLGWKDTFARPEFTARQYAYGRAFGDGHRQGCAAARTCRVGQRRFGHGGRSRRRDRRCLAGAL
jgi:hypothetical protein